MSEKVPQTVTLNRHILFARGSEQSMAKQMETMREYVKEHGVEVDHLNLAHVSANDETVADAIESLVTRKVQYDDFDTLLVIEIDRLTREYVESQRLLDRLAAAGISVSTVNSPVDLGEFIQDMAAD